MPWIFVLHMREFGVEGFGYWFIGFDLNVCIYWGCVLYIMWLCKVGWLGHIFVSKYAHMSNEVLLNELVCFGLCVESLVHCLCAWINVRTCNFRSGELGSPRQDMQGLVPFVCSRLSLRQRMFGLGERSSRLGEWVSPKRELERVGWFGLGIPLRREIPLFWAKEYLAQARVSRLSENAKNVLMVA